MDLTVINTWLEEPGTKNEPMKKLPVCDGCILTTLIGAETVSSGLTAVSFFTVSVVEGLTVRNKIPSLNTLRPLSLMLKI
ncbi:MAG: hypothetical protein BWY32_03866 [bacterium ADurb.Bin243]|nr:MAG: hypothetical protein BWY32_03866 [bacterium ADurb.Bin243]